MSPTSATLAGGSTRVAASRAALRWLGRVDYEPTWRAMQATIEETGERPQCDLLLELYCEALARHGKTGFIASAFPELLPESAREYLHARGVAALQGVEDGLAAWGRIAAYRQRREALLARGESALVPLNPLPLAGGALLDEWQSTQALRTFGLPVPQARLSTPERAVEDAGELG